MQLQTDIVEERQDILKEECISKAACIRLLLAIDFLRVGSNGRKNQHNIETKSLNILIWNFLVFGHTNTNKYLTECHCPWALSRHWLLDQLAQFPPLSFHAYNIPPLWFLIAIQTSWLSNSDHHTEQLIPFFSNLIYCPLWRDRKVGGWVGSSPLIYKSVLF